MAEKLSLKRRTFLRGVLGGTVVSVGLPALDIMFDGNGEALADGEEPPVRFGLYFWGNGVRPERWIPPTTGAAWAPSEELAPLAGVRDWVSVISGCEIKTATHPHHSGFSGVLTGARYHQLGTTRDTIVTTCARQTIDQVAADHVGMVTPYRSLEVGICHFRGTDEGSAFEHLSHNGPNDINPSDYSPSSVFNRLFSGGARDAHLITSRRSVLDVVSGQVRRLQARLGSNDRARLEQHFTSVRDIERRIASDYACGLGLTNPGDFPDVDGREQIEQKVSAMADLIANALACDLTRVFSILYSSSGSGVIVWQAGAGNSLHQICHDEPMPQPTVHAATTFNMAQLARFLEKLRDTPDGPGGSLLDRCSIFCTSELADGWSHSNREFPMLVAGKGGGRLRGGVHYRSGSSENTSHGGLTALRGAGLTVDGFGDAEGYVTRHFGDLTTF